MTKVVFYSFPMQDRIHPTLPVAAELAARGEQVVYYGIESYRATVEAAGVRFAAYPALPDDLLGHMDGDPLDQSIRVITACKLMLPELLCDVKDFAPDYVIYDSMAAWGWFVSRICNLPDVSSMPVLMFNTTVLMRSGKFFPVLRNMLKQMTEIRVYREIAVELEEIYGVKGPGAADILNNPGALTISYTSSLFQPSADALGSSFKFVGQSFPVGHKASETPAAYLFNGASSALADKPLLYISTAASDAHAAAFYQTCVLAFGNGPWRMVMAPRSEAHLALLETLPTNLHIVRPGATYGDALLQKADVHISDGAMSGITQALYYDVPLIVVPSDLDRSLVAGQVAHLGVGLQLDPDMVTAGALNEAAQQVVSTPEFYRLAGQIGQSLRDAGGAARAAEEILAFSGMHCPPRTGVG